MESRNDASGFIAGSLVQAGTIGAVWLPAPPPQALAGLPPDEGFVGRAEHLSLLEKMLAPVAAADTIVVSTVAGLAGVGKTALAVRAARRAVAEQTWFTGGCCSSTCTATTRNVGSMATPPSPCCCGR